METGDRELRCLMQVSLERELVKALMNYIHAVRPVDCKDTSEFALEELEKFVGFLVELFMRRDDLRHAMYRAEVERDLYY